MAKVRTKKQKKAADLRIDPPQVELSVAVKKKSPTTVLPEIQVHLLYRDLMKTIIVTGVVVVVLLSIFVYMR